MAREPTVVVITTGGTIACGQDPHGRVVPMLGADEARAWWPRGDAGCRVEVVPHGNVLGAALGAEDLFSIIQRARLELERPEVCGLVVTAGTGILEEASYLASVLNRSDKPIIWTGAQRSSDVPDADGARNVRDSVRVASSPGARGTMSLVCFNQEVHSARDVVKAHASALSTFTSYDLGIVARAEDDRVVFVRLAAPRPTYAPPRLEANVDCIKVVCGSDERFFRASVAEGAKAIVVEGFPGMGIVSPGARRGMLYALSQGLVVALGSRSPRGAVRAVYGDGIGARDLEAEGVLLCGDLSVVKARLLLMVLLGAGLDRGALRAALGEA